MIVYFTCDPKWLNFRKKSTDLDPFSWLSEIRSVEHVFSSSFEQIFTSQWKYTVAPLLSGCNPSNPASFRNVRIENRTEWSAELLSQYSFRYELPHSLETDSDCGLTMSRLAGQNSYQKSAESSPVFVSSRVSYAESAQFAKIKFKFAYQRVIW